MATITVSPRLARGPILTLPSERTRRAVAAVAAACFLALLMGAATAYSLLFVGLIVGLAALLILLKSPTALTTMFGVSAFLSAWFFAAGQAGLFASPSQATSIRTWSLLIFVGLFVIRPQVRVSRLLTTGILINGAGIIFSVPIGAMSQGSIGALLTGVDGIALAFAPLGIMILMAHTRSRTKGAYILLAFFAFECIYSLVQFSHLTWEDVPTTFFTVGNDIRWWDWKAVWGTFATTGKNAFGGAIALGGCVALAWFTAGNISMTKRLLLGVLFLLCAALAVMSESRSAALSLAAATGVIAISRRGTMLLLPAALGVLIIAMLPATSSAFQIIQSRGFQDDDAKARQKVWNALLGDRTPGSLLIGDGYNQVTTATKRLGVQGLAYSSLETDAPPPSENLYVRRLVEGGVFGLVTLIIFFGCLLAEAFAPSRHPVSTTWRLVLRGTVVALIIQSFFADTLMFPQWGAIFGLIIGIAGGALALDEMPDQRQHATYPAKRLVLGESYVDSNHDRAPQNR